jgi:hypothetical protein
MKGFDVYNKIDQMLSDPAWKGKIEFTYIGNLPKGYQFKNAFYLCKENYISCDVTSF